MRNGLLQPLAVVNPYSQYLTFVDDRTRTRRDHDKYLTLIDSIALLHQHQRPIKTVQHNGQPIRYVEVTLDDIETANQLAHDVLGRTLDELPPQTRKLLRLIVDQVTARCTQLEMNRTDYRFSRREVRDHTNWSDTALKVHLARLAEMEYLLIHRGGRGQSFVYELMFARQADSGKPVSSRPDRGGGARETQVRRKEVGVSGPSCRGQVWPQVGGCRGWSG